jgi:DNA-binding transcriptional MerR regulator
MGGKRGDWPASGIRDSDLTDDEDVTGGEMREQPLVGAELLTLGELTAAADVSVRTVRYYIAEGLLPPPDGSGPGSAYNQGHLDRLRLIQRLKEAYLPLKEIRRRLSGLSDDEVRSILAADGNRAAAVTPPASERLYDESLAGARDYLALLESREQYRTEPMALQFPAASAPVAAAQAESGFRSQPQRSRGRRAASTPIEMSPQHDEPVANSGTGLWHRIPLGDEAELVISDRVYGRHRDRIDWLVRWARKVFG